ncbi:hypothetical protein BUALT_Bualt15G0110900 [Buddleja alternifolia]|uniref:Agenet domain-containing protein n=1 Tax=Buddleja alternifolia TaxID=168488 RepID=A0AAV6WEA2_9LAMI|nr:hypothetical protein BUALT_Bualt15G0110900 [Buddleja alternifolia]
MAKPSIDIIAAYFKKGADVEISSNDDGFHGSWYAGTVVRPPPDAKRSSAKVVVEYKTLMEDKAGTRRLREEMELLNLRPPPPPENRRRFKSSEDVDAYYNDGWWEGIITDVVGKDKYLVFFRGSREQMEFKGSQLRLHREWVYGKWVPPFEPGDELQQPKDEKLPLSAKVEPIIEIIEHNFSPGELVEVSSDEDGFEGAWFCATVIENLGGKYLVEHQSLMDEDDPKPLREEVDIWHIRPRPPEVGLVDRFDVLEEVDALYNDGWWAGIISKVLKNEKYSVYFRTTDEEMKFMHADLRVHQEWINGKWVIPPKAEEL